MNKVINEYKPGRFAPEQKRPARRRPADLRGKRTDEAGMNAIASASFTVFCCVATVAACILTAVILARAGDTTEPVPTEPVPTAPASIKTEAVRETESAPVYIFRDGEGHPVDMQAMTDAWATEAGMTKRYNLTDEERWEVASVVTAEAVGEPYAGKVAVAQCILQACEDDGIRPDEALVKYGYAKTRPEPTEEALEAVQAVFDFGHVASTEPIKYFYAPARVRSDWHESQDFVVEINGHKFFKEAK